MPVSSFAYVILLSLDILAILIEGYTEKLSMPFKILLLILFCSALIETLTSFFFLHLSNDLFFYHIYNPIEFLLYSIFFSTLGMSGKTNKIIFLTIPIFIGVAVILSAFVQKIDENNTYVVVLESIIIIFYCLFYLRHLNLNAIETRAEKNPLFWLTIAILFNFTGTFFIEGFLNFLMQVSQLKARSYYKFSFLFKYLMCLLIFASVLLKYRNEKNKQKL